MDFVIALCDTPHGQVCPDFGEKFVTGAWPLPDPADFKGSPTERATACATAGSSAAALATSSAAACAKRSSCV